MHIFLPEMSTSEQAGKLWFKRNKFRKNRILFQKKWRYQVNEITDQLHWSKICCSVSFNFISCRKICKYCMAKSNLDSQYTKYGSFLLRISSVNVTKYEVSCGFGHIYWKNLYWKTSFFVHCRVCADVPTSAIVVSKCLCWSYFERCKF